MTRNESTELEGRPQGRYYAEHVQVTGSNPEAQLQEVLDAKEGKEWHLVGVAGGLHGEVWSSSGTPRSRASAGPPYSSS